MRWIGYQAPPKAIHHKVHLLKDGLTDKDLITQNERFIAGTAIHYLKPEPVHKPNRFPAIS